MPLMKTRETIWKFELMITDRQEIQMPILSEILTVQMQYGVPCLWAKVSSDYKKENKIILMYGTGHRIVHELGKYIGTFQIDDGQLIFHVFEGKEK